MTTSPWWRGAKATYAKYDYVVYRVFDATGRLIYIGSTRDIVSRFAQHERLSWWHSLIADVTTSPYPSEEAVRVAEELAIQEEQPAFNVRGTTNGPVLTPEDVEVALCWREQDPKNVLGGITLLDRVTAVLAAVPSAA